MKRLHISHNDLDGLGCGILIKKFLTGKTDTLYLGYDDIDYVLENETSPYDQIIITDVSPKYASVAKLISEKEIIIIDHHLSSEGLKEFPNVYHDITKCATMLTYDYITSLNIDATAYKNFAEVINDIDIWLMKRSDSLEMGILFNILGISRFEKRFLNAPYTNFNDTEQMQIDLESERKESYIKKAMKNVIYKKDKYGRDFAIIFAEAYTSELGNFAITDGALDYVVIINAQSKKISLRSHTDIDIRVIAEANGGGGHKNAAGFSIQNQDFNLDNILTSAGII